MPSLDPQLLEGASQLLDRHETLNEQEFGQLADVVDRLRDLGIHHGPNQRKFFWLLTCGINKSGKMNNV